MMMNYLCPRCRNAMMCVATASIPAYITYECFSCGYRSKTVRETDIYPILPECLREEEAKNEAD